MLKCHHKTHRHTPSYMLKCHHKTHRHTPSHTLMILYSFTTSAGCQHHHRSAVVLSCIRTTTGLLWFCLAYAAQRVWCGSVLHTHHNGSDLVLSCLCKASQWVWSGSVLHTHHSGFGLVLFCIFAPDQIRSTSSSLLFICTAVVSWS